MLDEQTIQTMQSLKLLGMAQAFEECLKSPKHAELSHAEFVGVLVQEEKTYREAQRLKRLLRNARLKQQACMEDIDYKHARGLNRQQVAELGRPKWIEAHRDVIVSGPTGIGKSWLACALGNMAARVGFTVLYVRVPRLFDNLNQARGDGTHLKYLARLAKAQVLILDDFLLTPLTDQQRQDFLEVIEDRHTAGSTVVTSQYGRKRWHERIGDPTIADAICDRLVHSAYKIELSGESIRKVRAERNGRPS